MDQIGEVAFLIVEGAGLRALSSYHTASLAHTLWVTNMYLSANLDDNRTKRLQNAVKLLQKDRFDEAISRLLDLFQEHENDDEIGYHLSLAYLRAQRPALALEILAPITESSSENPDVFVLLGEIFQALGSKDTAIEHFQRALALKEDHVPAMTNLGWLLITHRYQPENACTLLEKAVSLKSSFYQAQLYLAVALFQIGQTKKAFQHGHKALELAPKDVAVYTNLSRLYQQNGDKHEASRLLEKACAIAPNSGVNYYYLAQSHKFDRADRRLLPKINAALDLPLSITDRTSVHFALGKVYNDYCEWDSAFDHFSKGNQLIREEFDMKAHRRFITKVTSYYSKSYFLKHEATRVSEAPIFIIGMPRSGSTLIDQILASHSCVYSLDETDELPNAINQLCYTLGKNLTGKKKTFPYCVDFAKPDDFNRLAEHYLEFARAKTGASDDQVFVDKQLFNYQWLGMTSIIFPNAKIIHSCRNPLDTCLSCYFQYFTQSERLGWTYDLKMTGDYYRCYRHLMAHWHEVLPISILDVNYEQLVADPENQVRRILNHCGLRWEPACLTFYEKKRVVKTASLHQVRQPIYRDSVARWKHFARHLQPLVDGLGDVAAEYQQELESAGLHVRAGRCLPFAFPWR